MGWAWLGLVGLCCCSAESYSASEDANMPSIHQVWDGGRKEGRIVQSTVRY